MYNVMYMYIQIVTLVSVSPGSSSLLLSHMVRMSLSLAGCCSTRFSELNQLTLPACDDLHSCLAAILA